ncbi:MAG: aldehyde dehydrogenase family protein [Pseudomonadota bacterium]
MTDTSLLFIAGEWQSSDDSVININPSDLSDIVGRYSQASREQLAQAMESARNAQKIWAKTGLEKRYGVLMNIGQALIDNCESLGTLLAREEGKTQAEGKAEVYRSGQFFTYYGAEVLRQTGDVVESVRDGIEVDVRREPVGTIAIISPWNFPMATAVWKIAPAIAFGNAVIWKPANLVPASAVALTRIVAEQDIPAGLFNLVLGSGTTIGQPLVESTEIQAISFTGSVPVGRHIAQSAVENFTRIQLEMGSKNALAVMDDADLDLAVSCALNGAFGSTGQKCTASSRLVVHKAVHDEFVDRLVCGAEAMRVGHALDPRTQIGPVVSDVQLQQNLVNIELGKSEGAELLCGGKRVQRETDGYFMSPAVFSGTSNQWQINRDELFAPIACVIKVDSYDDALETVNDTRFGLTAGIMTNSLSRASDFRSNARTGCVMINLPTAGTDYHVPFGGRGESSYGPREQGQYAKEFYTHVKTAYISPGSPV